MVKYASHESKDVGSSPTRLTVLSSYYVSFRNFFSLNFFKRGQSLGYFAFV
jgi:hypothetical protein